MLSSTPFRYLAHLLTVPVVVGDDTPARFVLDTGIGLTLVSQALADRIGCEPTGAEYTGRRMSGQAVSVPLAELSALSMGDVRCEPVDVGILDLASFPPDFADVDGFLSLAFLEETPFTVDYRAQAVVLESAGSLSAREAAGDAVAVRVERDGPTVVVFLPLVLPDGNVASVEVDLGSDSLILDVRYAAGLGVDLDAHAVRRVEGTDETGGTYIRYFTTLRGTIHPDGAPAAAQENPDAMFQAIIHDGLVGHAFLQQFDVTYDVPRSRILLGRRDGITVPS